MANPFKAIFDSNCDSCGAYLYEDDSVFAVDNSFICESCAEEGNNICGCGNCKKDVYEKCYECFKSSIKSYE